MRFLYREMLLLALIVFMHQSCFSGEVRFLHLERFEGQSVQLIASDGQRSVDLTVTVLSGAASYDVPAGQWNMSLYLPGAVPLLHIGRAVPDAPARIGIASFVNAHIGGTVSGILLEGSYIADSSIRVAANSSLLVEAGCAIVFAPNAGINVAGRIMVQGRASNRVRLSAQEGNYWQGAVFTSSQYPSLVRNADFFGTSRQAVSASHATLLIDSCTVQQCGLSSRGIFGVWGNDGADIRVNNTAFNGTSNTVAGGAIAVTGSKLALSHCLLANHSSRDAAALISADNSPLSIANCVVYGNSGTGAFSAVRADNCSAHRISITNSIFAQNSAEQSPAGIWLAQKPSSLIVSDNVFYANNASNSTLLADNYLFHSDLIGAQQAQPLSTSTVLTDPLGNIWEDPQFEDPSTGDFRLRATSPVIRIAKETVLVKSSTGSSDANILPVGSGADTSYTGLCKYALLNVATYVSQPIDFANWDGYVVVRGQGDTIYANGTPVLDGYYIVDGPINITTGNNPTSIEQTPPVKLPLVDAGPDAAICAGESYLLSRSSVANYTLLRWTTDGDGVFSSASVLHPVYSPGSGDMARGAVILTLYAENGSAARYELNRMVLSVQPRLPLLALHEINACNAEPVVVEALYGHSFTWSTGSNDRSISITPADKMIYSLTATVGACVISEQITVQLVQPFSGTINVTMHADVVSLDIAAAENQWEQFTWTFDDTVSVSGKRAERQFLREGTHRACLTIDDSRYGCNAEICTNVDYTLPRFSLGGQIFCGKYPAQSATSLLYRLVNGHWVLIDSVVCRENAFFHYPQLPVGTYTVQGHLLGGDPSFGVFMPTFLGSTCTVDNARQVAHLQNSWKTDISLLSVTSIDPDASAHAYVAWIAGRLFVESSFLLDNVAIYSANGQLVPVSVNAGGALTFSCDAPLPAGSYVACLIGLSGVTECVSFVVY